jgi:hypothetical protein
MLLPLSVTQESWVIQIVLRTVESIFAGDQNTDFKGKP